MQKLFENWRGYLLVEGAKGLDDIGSVIIDRDDDRVDISIYDRSPRGPRRGEVYMWKVPAGELVDEEGKPLNCPENLFMILNIAADKGYGPLLLDLAFEFAYREDSYVIAGGHGEGTGTVAVAAANVLKYYYDKRSDVIKQKIPGCSDVLLAHIKEDPKYKEYIEALSYAYTKEPKLLPRLEEEGKLITESGPLAVYLFGKYKPPHKGHMDMLKHYIEEAEDWSDNKGGFEYYEINIILSEKIIRLDQNKFLDDESSIFIWEEYLANEAGVDRNINIESGGNRGYEILFDIAKSMPNNSTLLLGGGTDRIPELSRVARKIEQENTNIQVLDPSIYSPGSREDLNFSSKFREALNKDASIIQFMPEASQDQKTEKLIKDYLHDRWGTEKEDKPEELPPPEEVKEISLTSDGDFKVEFNNGAEAELLKYIVYVIARWGMEKAVKFALRWHKKIMIFLMKMHPAIFGPALIAQLFGFDISTEEFATFVYEIIAVVTEDDAEDLVNILVAIYEEDYDKAQEIIIKLIKNHIRRLQKKGCDELPYKWIRDACMSLDPTELFENKQQPYKIKILIKS